jgi:hypothetical protein
MTNVRAIALAGLMCLIVSAQARADVTGFIGVNTTPANRQVSGFAAGLGLLIVGFEFEYSDTTNNPAAGAPSLKVGSGNALLQTPVAFFGVQPYVTTGIGVYSETLGSQNDMGLAYNAGGGVKISLAGPLRLRVDYRVFTLGSGALYSPAHRVYAGINLKF